MRRPLRCRNHRHHGTGQLLPARMADSRWATVRDPSLSQGIERTGRVAGISDRPGQARICRRSGICRTGGRSCGLLLTQRANIRPGRNVNRPGTRRAEVRHARRTNKSRRTNPHAARARGLWRFNRVAQFLAPKEKVSAEPVGKLVGGRQAEACDAARLRLAR